MHGTQSAVYGSRATRGEVDGVEAWWGKLGQLGGEHRGRLGRREPGRGIGQLHHLRGGGFGQFRPPMADVDAPHAAGTINKPSSFGVPDMDPIAACGDQRFSCAEPVHLLPWMQNMLAIHFADRSGGIRKHASPRDCPGTRS